MLCAVAGINWLFLHECPQAGLPGFYDPCVGEEKSLKMLYQFRGVMHQVLCGDTEALRIPKQCEYANQTRQSAVGFKAFILIHVILTS